MKQVRNSIRMILCVIAGILLMTDGYACAEFFVGRVIPDHFDSRIDEDNGLRYLTWQYPLAEEEWTFVRDGSEWFLTAIRRTEHEGEAPDGTPLAAESIMEISGSWLTTVRRMINRDTGEILHTWRRASFPNILDRDELNLDRMDLETPPVCADGYNWSNDAHGYQYPGLLPKLFAVFFPEDTYVDGVLIGMNLEFIVRKADGTLVLRCGADEDETGWEWTESTPLPEGTTIGIDNFTDSLYIRTGDDEIIADIRHFGKGLWRPYFVNSIDFYVGPDWTGQYAYDPDKTFFGAHRWEDITTIDWLSLPRDEFRSDEPDAEWAARVSTFVDMTGRAVPVQPDPEGTTPLLAEAGKEDTLLGRFYNGTPLYVLEQGEEWTKVRIGCGEGPGTMTGWMETKSLAFGNDTKQVSRENIMIRSQSELLHPVEQFIGSRAGVLLGMGSNCMIIGEAETDVPCVIVYEMTDGDVGLIPKADICDGNG